VQQSSAPLRAALVERLSADALHVKPRIQLLVHLPHHRHIVAADDVQPQDDLLDAAPAAVDALVALVQDYVDALVVPLQRAHNVSAIDCDHGHQMVHVGLQGLRHVVGNLGSLQLK